MQVAIAIQKILLVIAINIEFFAAIKNARKNDVCHVIINCTIMLIAALALMQ
nr:MAG TPA: hypothetical protein [Caudoviricetes sp.]